MFSNKKKDLFDAVVNNDTDRFWLHLKSGVSANFERGTKETAIGLGMYMSPLFAAVKDNNAEMVVTLLVMANANPNYVSRESNIINTVYTSTLLEAVYNYVRQDQKEEKEKALDIYIGLRASGGTMYAANENKKTLGPTMDSIRSQLENQKIKEKWFWLENEFNFWKTDENNTIESKNLSKDLSETSEQEYKNDENTPTTKRRILI